MCNIISVSNRKLCGDFMGRLKAISDCNIPVILREKDLSEEEYEFLAKEAIQSCHNIILHTHTQTARKLGVKSIHLPIGILREKSIEGFETIGASVHSADEAREAENLGASYVIFGHVFETDCKKGLPPRGTELLSEVCRSVKIPVYAIGGITPSNAKSVIEAEAFGICVMSGLMQCSDVDGYIKEFKGCV